MDNLLLGMFKLYDIRTKEQNLTDEIRQRLYNAIVLYYKESVKASSIVICRDARLYVPQLVEGLTAAFTKAGINVLVNPLPISTCQFYYTCMKHKESAGIMVTASHNPREYVGMKLMAPGLLPIAYGNGPEGGIEKIKANYIAGGEVDCASATSGPAGKVTVVNELESYINYSMELAGVKEGSLKGLRVLIDFLNGSAGFEEALAFQKAGADVTFRNFVPNGFFPNGDPNPIIETSIAPAREAMKEGSFDIGFCFDGDGDRLDLMDSDGQQIVPGLNMSVIIPKVMEIYGNTKREFYADVKALPVALCEITRAGANVHIIRNGHSFIKAKLRDNCNSGYFASEEESAHYYMNFPYDVKDHSKGYAAVESTLFFALLTAKCRLENPNAYKRAKAIQNSIYRDREWPLYCEAAPEMMPQILDDVEKKMVSLGAQVIKTMDDGSDLDATLMRFNLPEKFDSSTSLEGKTWSQVAQRISRSEDAMVRWEVVSNDKAQCDKLNSIIREIADVYVNKGYARY
jgi:phosphomannomutase